jgi:hypothetical protein
MIGSTIRHTWMTRLALRISSSSGLSLPSAKAAPCVLDLLDQERPQAHLAMEPII